MGEQQKSIPVCGISYSFPVPVANCHTGACCKGTENSSQQEMPISMFRYAGSLHPPWLVYLFANSFLGDQILQVFNHFFECIKFCYRLLAAQK